MPVNKIPGTDLPQRLTVAQMQKSLAFQCPKCDAPPGRWCLGNVKLHTERVARMIDDEKEAFQARLAQKRYGLTLTEDERSSLQRILTAAHDAGNPDAVALWRKVQEL